MGSPGGGSWGLNVCFPSPSNRRPSHPSPTDMAPRHTLRGDGCPQARHGRRVVVERAGDERRGQQERRPRWQLAAGRGKLLPGTPNTPPSSMTGLQAPLLKPHPPPPGTTNYQLPGTWQAPITWQVGPHNTRDRDGFPHNRGNET